jgi:5-methyltetrahydropteroyltriglutamate--homocysteine methyltransferase
MTIPTEPIGGIPRPPELLRAIAGHAAGNVPAETLDRAYDDAVLDTVQRFEATGSPVITDGEQRKSSFATYPLEGLPGLAADGVVIPFEDGHTRQLPRLTQGPFRYGKYAGEYVRRTKPLTNRLLKQAVISASALSLLYPTGGIAGYPREKFIEDLVSEAAADIASAFNAGAQTVQIDFTEGRLSLKLDPSGGLLRSFVDLNNRVLERFSNAERENIGVHVCPGGDHDSTHSADVDYAGLLPALFAMKAGRFYLQLASEADRARVLRLIAKLSSEKQKIFVGPGARSSIDPPPRPGRNHRRLRLLPVCRRHLNGSRCSFRQDSRACGGNCAGRRQTRSLMPRAIRVLHLPQWLVHGHNLHRDIADLG